MDAQIVANTDGRAASTDQNHKKITQSSNNYGTKNCLDVLGADFDQTVHEDGVAGRSYVHKFGSNSAIGTNYAVVSTSGTYQTPSTAQTLTVSSDDANDTAAGTGMRTIDVTGIGPGWVHQTVSVTLNGTSDVTIGGTWLRVYRLVGTGSGTYASLSSPSHNSTITVITSGDPSTVWADMMPSGGLGLGQSSIGAFSVASGEVAYVKDFNRTIETNKSVDLLFFKRENADTVAAPFGVMRVSEANFGLGDGATGSGKSITDKIVGPADMGWLAKASTGTAGVSIAGEILIVQDELPA